MPEDQRNRRDDRQSNRGRCVTQITLKLKPQDNASEEFFYHIENRDREMHPTVFSYLNAAVELLEVSADGGRDFPILSEKDLANIEMVMLRTLRSYEMKKKEMRMLP